MEKFKITNLELTNSGGKIKAIATIEIPNIARVFGIKIMEGEYSLYCAAPTQAYYIDGIKKWSSVIVFEKSIWDKMEEEILEKYEEERNDG